VISLSRGCFDEEGAKLTRARPKARPVAGHCKHRKLNYCHSCAAALPAAKDDGVARVGRPREAVADTHTEEDYLEILEAGQIARAEVSTALRCGRPIPWEDITIDFVDRLQGVKSRTEQGVTYEYVAFFDRLSAERGWRQDRLVYDARLADDLRHALEPGRDVLLEIETWGESLVGRRQRAQLRVEELKTRRAALRQALRARSRRPINPGHPWWVFIAARDALWSRLPPKGRQHSVRPMYVAATLAGLRRKGLHGAPMTWRSVMQQRKKSFRDTPVEDSGASS
jgi:hypothetical protein